MKPEFKKFMSIENFSSMHHSIKKLMFVKDRPVINYRGKIKLHGTNAGIHISNNEIDGSIVVTAMKRTSFITPESDNAGFARWVDTNKHHFVNAVNSKLMGEEFTIFGEWAGPGVQNKDAVTQIKEKTFFIFCIRFGNMILTEPSRIHQIIQPTRNDIKILPWATPEYKVDFSLESDIQKFLDSVNLHVENIEKSDPYIKEVFDVDGPGEGLVFYPQSDWGSDSMSTDEAFFVFKAKTEAHSINGTKNKAAEIDPILHTKAAEFAAEYVTEARFNQALTETGITSESATPKDTGLLLKWICSDVHKESAASLEVSGIEWTQVSKAVAEIAKRMFFKMLEQRV